MHPPGDELKGIPSLGRGAPEDASANTAELHDGRWPLCVGQPGGGRVENAIKVEGGTRENRECHTHFR